MGGTCSRLCTGVGGEKHRRSCPWAGELPACCPHCPGAALSLALQKYDYDSSTVRKKFFREALLQITIPFLLKKLAPTCKGVRG